MLQNTYQMKAYLPRNTVIKSFWLHMIRSRFVVLQSHDWPIYQAWSTTLTILYRSGVQIGTFFFCFVWQLRAWNKKQQQQASPLNKTLNKISGCWSWEILLAVARNSGGDTTIGRPATMVRKKSGKVKNFFILQIVYSFMQKQIGGRIVVKTTLVDD